MTNETASTIRLLDASPRARWIRRFLVAGFLLLSVWASVDLARALMGMVTAHTHADMVAFQMKAVRAFGNMCGNGAFLTLFTTPFLQTGKRHWLIMLLFTISIGVGVLSRTGVLR